MLIQNNAILAGWLADKGYEALSQMPSFDVDEAQFNKNLDEVRHQHPHHDDLESQSRAVYRILTHNQNTSIAAVSGTDSPTAGTAIKAIDDLSRALRQQIGVLAGKTSVVEHACTTVTDGLEKTNTTVLETEKVIIENLAILKGDIDTQGKQLAYVTALIDQSRMDDSKRQKTLVRLAIGIIVIMLAIAFGLASAHAAPAPDPRLTNLKARPFLLPLPSAQFQLGTSYARVQFVSGSAFVNVSSSAPLPVTCISGCSGGGGGGGTSSTFGATFPASGTAAGASDGTNMQPLLVDGSGFLKVNVAAGGASGGTSSSFGAAFPATGTAIGIYDGTNMVALQLGQALAAASLPVILPSATITTLTPPTAAAIGTATSADLLIGTQLAGASVPTALPTATITTLTPPTAAAIGTATATDLLIGTQLAGASLPVALPTATITTLTPPSAAAIASAIVANPPAVTVSGNVATTVADGANVTLGAKADAKSTATDTTPITEMSVLKEISAMEQAPASRAVTNAGTFATQSAITAASGSIASGAIASGAIASGAVASGAVASGAYAVGSISDGADVTQGAKADAKSTATDTTAVSVMSVLKEISAMEQAPASRAVTNAGTFATQSAITAASGSIASGAIASGAVASGAIASGAVASGAYASGSISDGAEVTLGAKADAKSTATDTTAITAMQVLKEISFMAQTPAALPANQSTNVAQLNAHTTLEGGANGSLAVGGTVATNVAITANPINLGAQAVSSENSAVTTARQVQLVADLVGKLIVLPYANPENFVNGTTAAITDTTSTSTIASAGGSLRNYVTQITVTNSHATQGTFVKILEGTNIIWECYAAPAGGGCSSTFPVPLKGAAATAINCQPVTTGANVICSASGYKGL